MGTYQNLDEESIIQPITSTVWLIKKQNNMHLNNNFNFHYKLETIYDDIIILLRFISNSADKLYNAFVFI